MVKIEIYQQKIRILSNRRSKFKSFEFERGKLQNLSGTLQICGKLQICRKLQINVSKKVNRISINHKDLFYKKFLFLMIEIKVFHSKTNLQCKYQTKPISIKKYL